MTIGGFFIVLFIIIGLYGLFKKDDSTITGKDIDELIHELEEEIQNVDEMLANPTTYEDHTVALELSEKRDALQENLDALYDKWFELSDD